MKDSEVYRRAAELIDGGRLLSNCSDGHSCCAIDHVDGHYQGSPRRRYDEMFRPKGANSEWGLNWPITKRKECRILALLFMAAIAESEGR